MILRVWMQHLLDSLACSTARSASLVHAKRLEPAIIFPRSSNSPHPLKQLKHACVLLLVIVIPLSMFPFAYTNETLVPFKAWCSLGNEFHVGSNPHGLRSPGIHTSSYPCEQSFHNTSFILVWCWTKRSFPSLSSLLSCSPATSCYIAARGNKGSNDFWNLF